MAKASQVIVLAEDARHQSFIRHFLKRIDYNHHDIRFEPLPAGRGCGEQWVRENYRRVVAAYRQRATRAQTALIVAIDADTGAVQNRANQLGEALRTTGLQPRTPQERIAHIIPKRHIETWVLFLNSQSSDETTDYHRTKDLEPLIKPAALLLFDWARPGATIPGNCLPSLAAAIPEIRRIE